LENGRPVAPEQTGSQEQLHHDRTATNIKPVKKTGPLFFKTLLFLFKSPHDLDLLTSSQVCVLCHNLLLKLFAKNQFLEENTSSCSQVR